MASGAGSKPVTVAINTIADRPRTSSAPKPDWPVVDTFGDVLRVAFKKGGRVIEHLDHPLLNRLRG